MSELRITAIRHSAFYSPLLVTIAGGFLKEEGLEPVYELVPPGVSIPAALREGRYHVSQSAVATSFAEMEEGKSCDVVHFAQINERDGFFIAGRRPEPDFRWSDLIGKRVLVDHFFQPLAMLRYGLHRQGVEFDQLQVIDAGSVEEMDKAFREGEGDYVHQQGPAPQQLARDGIGNPVAAVGDAVGPVAFSSLSATREWEQSEMAAAFMRAYRKGRSFTREAPAEEVAGVVERFFPLVDRAVLAETIASYQRLGCWTQEVAIPRDAYEKLLDVFLYSGLITKRHPYEACVVPPPG